MPKGFVPARSKSTVHFSSDRDGGLSLSRRTGRSAYSLVKTQEFGGKVRRSLSFPMAVVLPPPVKAGDAVSIVAPASDVDFEILERAVTILRSW